MVKAASMSDMSTDHGTVTAERIVEAPIARVYAAFADPQERERWGAPSDTAVFAYDEADFRVGGRDLARCGPKEDPRFRVEARYLDIVPERRVVSAEIVREIERPLATNLTTLELRPRRRAHAREGHRAGNLVRRPRHDQAHQGGPRGIARQHGALRGGAQAPGRMSDVQTCQDRRMTTRMLIGKCFCGAVAYTVADAFLYAACCHCSNCRRTTGSAFKPFAGIERDKLALTEGSDKLMIVGDDRGNDTHCKVCGSLLYSVVRDGAYVHVAMGTLVDAPTIRPDKHTFVGSKAPWFTITDDLPQFDGHATGSK
jgi:uncharacterized protein YndB with AHSA1/START domain